MDRHKQRFKKRTAVTKEQALNFLYANEAADQNREPHRCGERNSNGITQPCGAAAPRNGDAHGARLRSEGSLLLSDVPSVHAKMAKYALLTAARAEVPNRAKRSEGSDSAPHPKRPLFRRVSRCVRSSGLGWRVYPPSPFETSVAAFVRV